MASTPVVVEVVRIPRDHALLTAVAVSFVLFLAVYLDVGGLVRVALGLMGVWALGYAILAAIYPRGADLAFLERQALGVAIGITALPIVGLAVGVVWGFWSVSIAFAVFLVTTGAGTVASWRGVRNVATERVAWSPLPPPRLSLGVGGAILIGAAFFAAVSAMQSHDEAISIALLDATGGIPVFPAAITEGSSYELVVVVHAPPPASLAASVTSSDGATLRIFDISVHDPEVPLVIDGLGPGTHHLDVVLQAGGSTRHLGAWLIVRSAEVEGTA